MTSESCDYYHIKTGKWAGKTLLVHSFDCEDGFDRATYGWARTSKVESLNAAELLAKPHHWHSPPEEIVQALDAWKNSSLKGMMNPTAFVVKMLGIKEHWTVWIKSGPIIATGDIDE